MKPVTRSSSPLVTPPSRPPARLVGRTITGSPARGRRIGDDLVVHLRARAPRALDAVADRHRLDRRNRHQRLGEPAIELAIPLHVAAEADRHVAGDHFKRSAEGVAGFLGRIDRRHHLLSRAPCRRTAAALPARGRGPRRTTRRCRAGTTTPPMPVMWLVMSQPIAQQQLAGDRAGGDARRGFARAGALEHVANVVVIVFERAGEVGMTRAAAAPPAARLAPVDPAGACALDVHRVLPVLPILVAHQQRDRRAGGLAAAHARQELGAIGFDRHAAAAAVAALAAPQLQRDGVEIDRAGRRAALRGS